jgi:transcriptional regulator with XRE-family HTH domain
MLSPEQCRAARGLLGWSQSELERHSGVARRTIYRLEIEGLRNQDTTLGALRRLFETNGVQFIDEIENVRGGGAVLTWEAQQTIRGRHTTEPEEEKPFGERLADYWQGQPERWAAFSPETREILENAMFGDRA